MSELSIAHKHDMNWYGVQKYVDRLVPWDEAAAPDHLSGGRITMGRLRSCAYCGSMHPADVAAAIRAGATGHFADRKYGWPHKAYFDGVPNPHKGMLETRSYSSKKTETYHHEVREQRFDEKTGERLADNVYYTEEPKPASATTGGKFYTVHLQDASADDRKTIELHLGVAFTFTEDGSVSWQPAGNAYPPE